MRTGLLQRVSTINGQGLKFYITHHPTPYALQKTVMAGYNALGKLRSYVGRTAALKIGHVGVC